MRAILDKLEKKFGNVCIPNITIYLIAGQVIVLGLISFNRFPVELIILIPERVLQGEIWRLATFLIVPSTMNPLWAFFAWYLFYLMGSALENYWSSFKYNFYLFIAYVATVSLAFIFPYYPVANSYLYGSVFLAFAFLYPNFQIHLFFLLPVKVKWLALLTWAGYALGFINGNGATRLTIVGAVSNYLLFFGTDIFYRLKSANWKMQNKARQVTRSAGPDHTCVVCSKNSNEFPDLDFRYCSKCEGQQCYCPDHLRDHRHVVK
ncbi:MAG: hypothetical protein GF398_08875 [Chitinivibrionales bacterium]|nr:hypothetical protein [Chitinivibrionales bacterium]